MFYSVDDDVIFNKRGLKSDYYVYEIKHIPFLVINNMDKTVYFSVDKCKQVMVLSNVDGKKYKMSYSDEKQSLKIDQYLILIRLYHPVNYLTKLF